MPLDECADTLSADARDSLREIQLNASKMATLIDGLVSMSRITRSELRRASVGLTRVALAVADRLAAAQPFPPVAVAVQEDLHADVAPPLARALVEVLLEKPGNAPPTRTRPASRWVPPTPMASACSSSVTRAPASTWRTRTSYLLRSGDSTPWESFPESASGSRPQCESFSAMVGASGVMDTSARARTSTSRSAAPREREGHERGVAVGGDNATDSFGPEILFRLPPGPSSPTPSWSSSPWVSNRQQRRGITTSASRCLGTADSAADLRARPCRRHRSRNNGCSNRLSRARGERAPS